MAGYKTSLFFEIPKWLSIKPSFFWRPKFGKKWMPITLLYNFQHQNRQNDFSKRGQTVICRYYKVTHEQKLGFVRAHAKISITLICSKVWSRGLKVVIPKFCRVIFAKLFFTNRADCATSSTCAKLKSKLSSAQQQIESPKHFYSPNSTTFH